MFTSFVSKIPFKISLSFFLKVFHKVTGKDTSYLLMFFCILTVLPYLAEIIIDGTFLSYLFFTAWSFIVTIDYVFYRLRVQFYENDISDSVEIVVFTEKHNYVYRWCTTYFVISSLWRLSMSPFSTEFLYGGLSSAAYAMVLGTGTYYCNPQGKTVWSKAKSWIKSKLEARTPLISPIPSPI